MATINASDLSAQWVHLLEHLARGEQVTVMQDGRPVATLAPIDAPGVNGRPDRAALDAAFEYVRNLRPRRPLTDDDLRGLIEEGRRF